MPKYETNQAAIKALILLTNDLDEGVRDWATFGLGSLLDLDTAEIRGALVARLKDPDLDTRYEAMVGLARRGDPAVIPAFLQEIESIPDGAWHERVLLQETAEEIVRVAGETAAPIWNEVVAEIGRE